MFKLRSSHIQNQGYATVVVMMGIAIIVGLALTLSSSLLRKSMAQLSFNKESRRAAVLNAVIGMAMRELKMQKSQQGSCSLSAVLNPTSTTYKEAAPRKFAKGNFQIDVYDENQSLLPFFFAPEDNPEVWIDPESPAGSGRYRLHVRFKTCDGLLLGRNKLPDDDTSLNLNWSVACPTERTHEVRYTGVINTNAWSSIHTIYVDRSYFGNFSMLEPTEDMEADAAEKLSGGATPTEVVEGEPLRRVGGTHDQIRCTGGARTDTILSSYAASLASIDPCGKVSVYVVGGSAAAWGTDPSPGNVVIRAAKTGGAIAESFEVRDVTKLQDHLFSACRNYYPAGSYSYTEVLRHYIANYQPAPGSVVNPVDRARRRNLILITDGTGIGPLSFEAGAYDAKRLRQSTIYYTGNNCTGTAMVETFTDENSAPLDFSGNYVMAADRLYDPGVKIDGGLNGGGGSAALPTDVPPPPYGAVVVRSAMSEHTGLCSDILDPGTNEYNNPEYGYYVLAAQAVSPRGTSPTTATEIFNRYIPIDIAVQQFTTFAASPTNGLKEYPNTLEIYPIPLVDLDEQNIETIGISMRPYNLSEITKASPDAITNSYVPFIKWIDPGKTFKTGITINGLQTGITSVPPEAK